MNFHQDERGVIVSWFVKIALFMIVGGVILYDIGSIVVNNVSLGSTATEVATAVSLTVDEGPSVSLYTDQEVWRLAREAADLEGMTDIKILKKGTEVDEEGIVYVRLRRKAPTLVAKYVPPLERYTIATVTGQAGTN
jgi:hypothetical protein